MNVVTVDTGHGRIYSAIKVRVRTKESGKPIAEVEVMKLGALIIIPEVARGASYFRINMAVGAKPEGFGMDLAVSWNSHAFI